MPQFNNQPSKINNSPARGYFYIASAAFLWGVSAALGRAVFTGKLALAGQATHPIEPVILSQTRTTFSLLVLLPILIRRDGRRRIHLPTPDLIQCLILGVLGVAASNYFYYVAVQKTSVAIAIVVQYTAPVWVLLYVVARGQQRLTLQKIAAVAVAIAGIALTIGIVGNKSGLHLGSKGLDTYGLIAAVLASFSFAFYNVGGHRILARYDRWRVLVWTLAAAAIFWLVFNPPWKVAAAHYTPAQWTFLFVFSMISVLLPFSLYFQGLQHLEPTRAIIASCLEPVFSILLAAALLGESVRPIQTLGIVLVLAAIVIVQLPSRGGEEAQVVVDPIE
jgi:drug/metabolite transporter (DMT)-like permease